MARYGLLISFVCALSLLGGAVSVGKAETLANGFKYLVQRRAESQIVAIDVWVRAGASQEEKGESGCAHFLEHALFKGTTHRKRGEADLAIEQLGGIWQAGTGQDYVHLYTTVVPEALDSALEILNDLLGNATLPTEEIEKERRVILDELGKTNADLTNRLVARLYKEALLLLPPGGTPETIQHLSREKLAAFYKRNYTPYRCTLVLVGNVTEAQAAQSVEKVFGNWKTAPPKEEPLLPVIERISASFVDVKVPPQDAAVAMGWNAPPANSAKMSACARVLAEVMGSDSTGRLALPDLAGTNVLAQYTPRRDTSLFIFTAKLPVSQEALPERVTRLEAAVLSAVTNLAKQPVTALELQYAKRQTLTRLRLDAETCLGLSHLMGYAEVVNGQNLSDLKQTIAQLSTKDIQEYVLQYLLPHQRVVVRYLPDTGGEK